MRILEMFIGGALFTIVLFLFFKNARDAKEVMESIASSGIGLFGVLQGRQVSGGTFNVSG